MDWKRFKFFGFLDEFTSPTAFKPSSVPPAARVHLHNIASQRIAPTQEHIEGIRKALLDCMDSMRASYAPRPVLWGRVIAAQDLQSLWYLRGDVMMYLSSYIGESQARARIQPITEMFRGLLSDSQLGLTRKRTSA
jgi:hypothetical protein